MTPYTREDIECIARNIQAHPTKGRLDTASKMLFALAEDCARLNAAAASMASALADLCPVSQEITQERGLNDG